MDNALCDTWSAVIGGGTTRGVPSVAPQGAVGAGAGRPPLTGGLLPIALDAQTHQVKKVSAFRTLPHSLTL